MIKKDCKLIVDRAYPKIKEYYGKSRFNSDYPKVDYHYSIYARITGEIPSEIEVDPAGDFERDTNTIWVYYPAAIDEEWVIRTLLHEYQHYLQDEDEMKRLYESGYGYEDHPFEIEAINAEEEWSLFL